MSYWRWNGTAPGSWTMQRVDYSVNPGAVVMVPDSDDHCIADFIRAGAPMVPASQEEYLAKALDLQLVESVSIQPTEDPNVLFVTVSGIEKAMRPTKRGRRK